MEKKPWEWSLDDIKSLIGIDENLQLEFKRSDVIFDKKSKIESLTKEISAFANTQGGTIVIGLAEEKVGNNRKASHLDDGISLTDFPLEQIIQKLESNLHPPLIGIRYKSIQANSSNHYLVIYVPSGTTAYQSSDHIYYGRSERESRPLLDHEIKLRMNRRKYPEGRVIIKDLEATNSHMTSNNYIFPDSCNIFLRVYVENIGEINFSSMKVSLLIQGESGIYFNWSIKLRDGKRDNREVDLVDGNSNRDSFDFDLFPNELIPIYTFSRSYESYSSFINDKVKFTWTLNLPDRPPLIDEISLSDLYKSIPLKG